jgi:hypothetical protein
MNSITEKHKMKNEILENFSISKRDPLVLISKIVEISDFYLQLEESDKLGFIERNVKFYASMLSEEERNAIKDVLLKLVGLSNCKEPYESILKGLE